MFVSLALVVKKNIINMTLQFTEEWHKIRMFDVT